MNGDWSAWLRVDGSSAASETMIAWASQQPDAFGAWRHCPRADWLMLGLVRSRTDWRSVVAAAAALARTAEPCLPMNERRPRQALDAVESWVEGHAGPERILAIGAGLFANARYIADTSAVSARAKTHYDTSAASIAAARSAVRAAVMAARGDHDAANAAVEAAFYAAQAPAHLGEWRTEIVAAHRRLTEHLRSLTWPARQPRLDLHLQAPALQIAWDRVAGRCGAAEITTIQLLAAMSAWHQLKDLVHGQDLAEGASLAAVAERIAADDRPLEILDEVRRILASA